MVPIIQAESISDAFWLYQEEEPDLFQTFILQDGQYTIRVSFHTEEHSLVELLSEEGEVYHSELLSTETEYFEVALEYIARTNPI